jgi:nickel/cobalt transporter (NicO) family protein
VNNTLAILLASVGVGLGHAVLPDHWIPLAVIGRTERYPLKKIARLSGVAGVAHVLLSIVLGAIIIAVGLQFRSTVQSDQDTIIGGLLLATGLGFVVLELSGRGHHHGPGGHTHDHDGHHPHDDGHTHDHDGHHHDHAALEQRGWRRLSAVMIPFGAAASPDLTILPVFLAAAAAGVGTAIGSVLLFAAATIGTIVGLTLLAAVGGYQFKGDWLERWGNVVTAGVLLVIGTLVLTGTI